MADVRERDDVEVFLAGVALLELLDLLPLLAALFFAPFVFTPLSAALLGGLADFDPVLFEDLAAERLEADFDVERALPLPPEAAALLLLVDVLAEVSPRPIKLARR